MNKFLKKALAVALSACMCVGLVGTALAATTSSTDTGTITVSGLGNEANLAVNAYQIAKADYDTSGNVLGYSMVSGTSNCAFQINYDGSYDESALTEANLAELFSCVSSSVYKTASVSNGAISDGTATFSDMAVGSYLFVVTGSESTVYGMVIGSCYYYGEDGEWKIDNGSIDVSKYTVVGDNVWMKSTTPTVEKTETGGSLGDYEHGGSADMGDTLEYHITVNGIPSYQGSNPEFEVTDKLSTELTITTDEINAMVITTTNSNGQTVTLTKGTDYTVTADSDGHGFTVSFVVDGKYTLNDYAGKSLLIDFKADVTGVGDASADDDDHINDVTLLYATTSYVSGQEGKDTDEDHDYTFNAKIKKVDSETENALSDATFTMYTNDSCTSEYQQNGTTVTATSGNDGYFEFTGLEEGTYYFKETTAPAGYALNQNVYKIVITANYNEDGTLKSDYTVVVTDVTNNNTSVGSAVVTNSTAVITNTQLGELPSMGSTGITLCIIAGCVVLAGAVAGVVIYRRRNNAEV